MKCSTNEHIFKIIISLKRKYAPKAKEEKKEHLKTGIYSSL